MKLDTKKKKEKLLQPVDYLWQNLDAFWLDRPVMLELIADLPGIIADDAFYDAMEAVEAWYLPFVEACCNNVVSVDRHRRFTPKHLAASLRVSRDKKTRITFPPESAAGVKGEVKTKHKGIAKTVVQKPPPKPKAVKQPTVVRPQRSGRSTRNQSVLDKGEGSSKAI